MKYVIFVIIGLAIALAAFNISMLDLNNIMSKESSIALAGVLASLCVLVLMLILLVSRSIQKKYQDQE